MKEVKETSFGIIPFLHEETDPKVFIVKHANGNFWGFPKGHSDHVNESAIQTAVRELKEETSLEVLEVYDQNTFEERYTFIRKDEKVLKTVMLFLAKTTTDYQVDGVEILEAKWVLLKDLAMHLTYKEAKDIAKQLVQKFSSEAQ